MDGLLFPNKESQELFYTILAKRKLVHLKSTNGSYDEDVNNILNSCAAIFEEYSAEYNFIEELYRLESGALNIPGQELSSKKAKIIQDFEEFKARLPLGIKEDLEFYMSQIRTRQGLKKENAEVIGSLNSAFPKAMETTMKEAVSKTPLKEIFGQTDTLEQDSISYEEAKIEEELKETPIFENEKTVSSDESLKDLADDFNPYMENESLFSEIMAAQEKKSYDGIEVVGVNEADDNLKSLAGLAYIQNAEKNSELDDKATFSESITSDDDFVSILLGGDTHNLETDFQEAKVSETELVPKTSDNVEFTMEDGITLIKLATALCGYESGWTDIYKENQTIIEQRMVERNYQNIDQVQNDPQILSGLSLIIPNTFNKEKGLGMAA